MKCKSSVYKLVIFVFMMFMVFSFAACKEIAPEEGPLYSIDDNESNQINKDMTTKGQAIDKVTTSITNLKTRLNSQDVGEGGYYTAFDFHINTANGSNFVMKLQAHLFTWPYMNEFGVIRENDLAKHNELIKKSTLLIEWYDGITNNMLIGFYFDGIKANPNDPGNILYLNLQGEKRWFPDFGDSVLYQQMIRLITSFSLDDMLTGAGIGDDGGVGAIATLLDLAITNNYKLVLNKDEKTQKDVTSVLFNSVNLDIIKEDLTGIIQKVFSPFGNKIDPLTNKYLGFKFSTLGRTSIQTINSDMQFFIEPDTDGVEDLLTGAYIYLEGAALVDNVSVPFTADVRFYYGAAPPKPIQLDKEFYKYYDYGKYEFTGNLYIPAGADEEAGLNLDALIRTKVNEFDNTTNNVFGEFRDIANGDLIIGTYYKNELAYLDIEGLQHLYGGIRIEDIGFPKVYIEGWDLADMLHKFFDMVDNTIVSIVDSILDPSEKEENQLIEVIMAKMESTEKVAGDPYSRNSVMIRIDHELIKDVLREGGYGTYTTRDIINIINAQLPITLDEIATILGITSAEILLEKTWIKLRLDVDTNELRIEIFSDIGIIEGEEPSKLLMRLDLVPVKIGEDMVIAEISFEDFNELLPIYTYSAEMGGQFLFSNAERVELSELLSAFMDDVSGKNTPYVLPMESKLDFTLVYDQYIREQRLQKVPGGPRDGRMTQSSRNAFILNVFIKGTTEEDNVTLFNIYANDVSFKSDSPVEELGYIWVDLVCIRENPNLTTIPKFKIREDYWLQSINRYMNKTEAGENVGTMLNPDISLSITTIISALMEDSLVVFQPEQIEITTSNETMQNIFGVDSLIGTINAQIGLVQRVFGVDEIEDEFANYVVGDFENIYAEGPYTTKLHDTIDVTFIFEQDGRTWNEVVPLLFDYEPNSVAVVDGKTIYNPRINGPILENEFDDPNNPPHRFMGAKRSYSIYMAGKNPQSLRIINSLFDENYYDPFEERVVLKEEIDGYSELEKATFESIKHRMLPHYRLEPMLPKPTKMDTNVGVVGSGFVMEYASNILIDWDKVTLSGGEYFTDVLIAEGMMGETYFPVHIIVTNRVIDTTGKNPKVVNVTAVVDSDALTECPVVDKINIDPYDYLWAKAVYFEKYFNHRVFDTEATKERVRAETNLEFIQYYFGEYLIEIRFVDFDPDITDFSDTPIYNQGGHIWYFDRYKPTEYYDETDIVLTGGSTYLHTNFFGQIVALQVNIASRTIRAIYFDGEEENDVYTVDMLEASTYVIPLYPTIIFEEKDDGDRHITKRFHDAENDIYVPMNWSNPVVNRPNINGTDTPFEGSTSNETSSYIDFFKALNVGEWIFKDYSPIRVIRVDCPSKEIAELPHGTIMGYENLSDWNSNTKTEIYPSYITIGNNPSGFYYVDPFNPNTARIPKNISVTFKGRLEFDPNYSKNYDVIWDTSSGLVEYVANGDYYRLTVNSEDEKFIKLTTSVGNDFVGYTEIVLCVKILTSNYTNIVFYNSNNETIDINGTSTTGYIYKVDTYEGFDLPYSFVALFGESDERQYYTNWRGKDSFGEYTIALANIYFKPGSVIELITTLPGGNGRVLEVKLTINIDDRTVSRIIFTNIPMWKNAYGEIVKLPITLRLGTINDFTIEGLVLNSEGKIDNLYFGRGFYDASDYELAGINVPFINGIKDEWDNYIQNPVQPISLYPYELYNLLFKNACIVFESEDPHVVDKLIKENLQIYNLKGIMNIQDILQKVGDTTGFGYGNGKYVIRLGQGKGAHDLIIRTKFYEGLYVESNLSSTANIDLYTNEGVALWGANGYVFAEELSATINATVQATGYIVTFQYGKTYGQDAPLLTEWYVEESNIPSILVDSYITGIPLDILYESSIDYTLKISFLTEVGFRLIRNIKIVKVSFGNQYNSIKIYNDIFEITAGKITITDLYKFNPLNAYLASVDFLPKVINRTTANYNITLTDIKWTIHTDWRNFLDSYDYSGDVANKILATADILGWYETVPNQYGVPIRVYHDQEKITLLIKVDSAYVTNLSLEASHGLKTSYEDITVTSSPADETNRQRILSFFDASTTFQDFTYREHIIYVDAYRNNNYQGIFVAPQNLVVSYISGVYHTFAGLRYKYRGVDISEIKYGIDGIIYQTDNNGNYIMIANEKVYLLSGDDKYNITLTVFLGAGQTLAVRVHFFDKTVVSVRPVIEYNDQEIRDHITNELSDFSENIKQDIIEKINITKIEHDITITLQKNKDEKEIINKKHIYNEIKKINRADGEATRSIISSLLNLPPVLYEDISFGEDYKVMHNYVATILINLYAENLQAYVDMVYDLIEEYLDITNETTTFADIENKVSEFYNEIFEESARRIINNKIVDFVQPKIISEVQKMNYKQQVYVIKLKNKVEAELNVQNILKGIDGITSTTLQAVKNTIGDTLNAEFERMINHAIGESTDEGYLIDAVISKIRERKVTNDAAFVDLRDLLANIHLGIDTGNMRTLIEAYFNNLFYFVEDNFNMTSLVIVQEVEKTISNLVIEMRASVAAGLIINTGGRLTRAINLSVAAAINNVIVEGRIIDAMKMALGINTSHTNDGLFAIDPYGDYIFVPTRTEVIFSSTNGGESYLLNINWTKPASWSTPRNPNAGVSYKGNEGYIRDAMSSSWEILYAEIIDKYLTAEGSNGAIQLSIEDDLLYRKMSEIINSIYMDLFGTVNLTDSVKADGWAILWSDPEISHAELLAIESRVLAQTPTATGERKEALCFDKWAHINAWQQLKVSEIADDIETPENENAIWGNIKLKFARRELASLRNEFTASLYSEGIGSQDLNLIIMVENRELAQNNWNLYKEDEGDYSKTDPLYHIEDPFVSRVDDFPYIINLDEGIVINGKLVSFSDLFVNWQFTDEAITYSGSVVVNESTGKMGLIISGYIKNNRVGQEVKLRLVINSWEYNETSGSGLRQYSGPEGGDIEDEDNYTIMNPISFIFSKLVDYSAQEQYQVMIKEKQYKNEKDAYGEITREWTEIVYKNVIFYPEDSMLIRSSIDDAEMETIMQRRNYLLYWDAVAKGLAFNSNGVPIPGSFSLGNLHKNRLTRANSSQYLYEEPYINKVNATDYTLESLRAWFLANGYATNNNDALALAQVQINELYGVTSTSMLVINPLNPQLPRTVNAIGLLNQVAGTNLGEVRIFWNKSYNMAKQDMTAYIKYKYPTLTIKEAEKSAMELLIDTTRSKAQEEELIEDITKWLKVKWATDYNAQLSDFDNESWAIYYNNTSTSAATKNKMDNLFNIIQKRNGNRTSDELKNEGWYRMYTFLEIYNSDGIRTEEEKSDLWTSLVSSTSNPSDLLSMRQRIEALNASLSAKEINALAYDEYTKWNNWNSLKLLYSGYAVLTNELSSITTTINGLYPTLTIYEKNAKCWDVMLEKFAGEDLGTLDALMTKVRADNPDINEMAPLRRIAWDRWIVGKSFKEWMLLQSKEILLIDESYDMQTASGYLGGGIDGSKNVTLLLQLTKGGYIHTQTFKIRLVFMDLTPLAYYSDINGANGISGIPLANLPTEITIAAKVDYKKDTDYVGAINPYNNHSPIIFNMLDYFTGEEFAGEIVTKSIGGQNVDVKMIRLTNIIWNIPAGSKAGDTIRSTSFTIGNVTYQSNLLKMVLT